MSEPNVKPSQLYPNADKIVPQSVAAAATVTSGWVSAAEVKWAHVTLVSGAGAGTFAAKLEQATSSGGAGAKDLVTAATLGITALAASTVSVFDYDVAGNIDVDNSFAYFRLSVTCTGGAGTLFAAAVDKGPAARQA